MRRRTTEGNPPERGGSARLLELPPAERPRERLVERGAAALSDGELLALLLRDGVAGESTLDQARLLLAAFGGAAELGQASVRELGRMSGIGVAKACAVLAGLELGRRSLGRRLEEGAVFRSAAEVFAHFHGRLAPLRKEVFCLLLLDTRHRKLREVQVSEGSLSASIVHPREVFSPAVRDGAAAIILVHNHPSGDPTPSPEDAELTRRLRQAGDMLGIRVLDHVIVGIDRHFSFVEAGWW